MVDHSVERPSEGHCSVQFYRNGFESRPQHKVEGKKQSNLRHLWANRCEVGKNKLDALKPNSTSWVQIFEIFEMSFTDLFSRKNTSGFDRRSSGPDSKVRLSLLMP